MTSKPLTLHITWHFPPEQVPTFYEVLRPLHERIKEEKECLYFNVYEIAQQPGVVRLVEIWDCDMKWMVEVQSKKDYYGVFLEAAKKIALQPQKIEVMKGVEEFRIMNS